MLMRLVRLRLGLAGRDEIFLGRVLFLEESATP
jgi:hypothetical protein